MTRTLDGRAATKTLATSRPARTVAGPADTPPRRLRAPSARAAQAARERTAIEAARAAGLRYVGDDEPGIRRVRAGRGFSYRAPDGTLVRDAGTLRRIRSLAIPPAWTDVWISPHPRGHIQAIGRDKRNRKQYRYHPAWRAVRDEAKYERTIAFAEALPRIRARVDEDMARPGLPRDKVVATVVKLLETTFMRVGNDEYARHNRSYGLTTLRDGHVRVDGTTLRFRFRGKSGRLQDLDVKDRRLARVVKRCQELPGQRLFQYLDENGDLQSVASDDVNEYLRGASGADFTAKDFRTWAGTVLAAHALRIVTSDSERAAKSNVVRAIEDVAKRLGNTVAVCRKCYVHPAVIDSYLDGTMAQVLQQRADDELADSEDPPDAEERMVLRLLRARLREAAAASTAA